MKLHHRGAVAVAIATLGLGCHGARARSAEPSEARLTSADVASEQREQAAMAQERTRAHDRLVRERADAYATLQQRLGELDKRAHDAHANSADLDPDRKSDFDRAWYAYTAEHRDVEGAMHALSAAPNRDFALWNERTKQQLDELQRAVDALDQPR